MWMKPSDWIDLKMICDEKCCVYGNNETLCFGDYNFTDRVDITHPEDWELAVKYGLASLIFIVAVTGNITIITILLTNRILLRTSVNQFILNMSVADLITAIAGPIPYTIRDTNFFWVLGGAWCYLEGYIQMMVMMVSVVSLATISFDRMVGIVFPFHKHLSTVGCTLIILAIWVVSALIALPFGFYRVYTVRIWNDLTERTCGERTKDIRMWWIVIVVALNWLPLVVMVLSYAAIFIYLKQHRSADRREHPAMLHLKKRVMRMMFVVVLVFIVCWLPFQVLKVAERTWVDSSGHINPGMSDEYNTLLATTHYMIYLNTALNPIIYGLLHQTFRRAFRVTCACLYKSKPSFILRKSDGTTRYVWSALNSSTVYHQNLRQNRRNRNLRDRLRRSQVTSKAVVVTPALAASIALHRTIATIDQTTPTTEQTTPTTDHTTLTMEQTTPTTDQTTPKTSKNIHNPYINEGYVHDLPQRGLSVRSTGVLGHLINQVIEEESSSDIDNTERIL